MSRAARLGAFIVATLAILAAGIFIIGSKQYLFSSTYQLKAQFDNVEGLDQGGDVRVGGVHSGTVRNIVLPHKPGEKVTVVMDLGKSTHEIIKQDSVASIETEGLLGNQYMAISLRIFWDSRRARWRYYRQPAAARNVRPAQENERPSGQQPASHPERHASDGESGLDQRQNRSGPRNRGSTGQQQTPL